MSMTLDLPAELDRKLDREAERQGAPKNELVAALLERALAEQVRPPRPSPEEMARRAEFFRQWVEEGQAEWDAMTDEEKAEAEEELRETKRAINANRLAVGAAPTYPEAL